MNELHSIDNNHPNNGNYDHKNRSTTTNTSTAPTTNGSKFKHPLSKNTCQLTKSGNDLVIDDSDGGYATPPEIIPQSMANEYRYLTKNDHENPDDPDDLDKTPTNQCPLIQFDHVLDQLNGNSNSNSNGHDTNHHDGIGIDDEYETVCMVHENNLINEESSIAPKKSFLHSFASKVELVAPKIKQCCSSNESKSDNSLQSSPTLSQKSTDSETKMIKSQLFTIKAQVSEQSSKNSSLERNTLLTDDINLEDNIENNYETIGEPIDDVSVPASVKTIDSPTKCDQINIDLKRIKVRPLSSVSISSTSSSSSSASDEHSTNQTAISYLASVESLADHSENELVALSATLTVTERACLEIVDSERSYVDDLGQVIKGYLNDWRERDCLKADDLETLFGNIQEVHDFSTILLNEFDQTGMDPTKISKCFIRLQDQFDVYTQYCTCYPDAISLLTTLLQASNTNALLASTQKSLQHTLPLGSYLLKPVQRILKYHLLLDNLRKHCDVVEVVEAHGIMRNVARHIDQVKRNLEQQSRVRELSGILDGWLGPELTVLGDLIREGTLMENNKPRTVLLFETMLIITKKKEDNRLQFKTYIHCKNLMLIEHFPGEQASFSVIPYNDVHPNQIKLTARNRDQKRQWAQHIKQVMLAHFDIPNRAKELLFKLGEEDDRTPDKNTWKWNNNSSTTPEYLERRNQYRRSEMRYRSKKQRKIFSASLSMVEDSFDKEESNDSGSKSKVLDSMIKELQERNSLSKHGGGGESTTSTMSLNDLNLKSDELSQNEYEMPFDANKALPSKPASALDKAKSKLLEVRMYNTKTLPKRIANLKKQRSKTLKETSKFYMALPEENSETVLKITESSDDIAINDARIQRRRASLDATDTIAKTNDDRKMSSISLLSPMNLATNKNKRDIDIISELLKDHKDFDRILKKPPKKLSGSDSDVRSIKFSRSESFMSPLNALRLPLPPIPVEAEKVDTFVQRELPPEPIYESLLRNVHVPYKFPSPVLNRSFSSPNSRLLKIKRPTEAPPKRPDSDYVTLTFDENGELAGVDDDICLPKHGSHLRKSDTNINYHVRRLSEDSSIIGNTEILASRESTSSETDYSGSNIQMQNDHMTAQQISQSTDIVPEMKFKNNNNSPKANDLHKSVDHLNISKTAPKIPERRVSDVTGMHRQSIIHKQGSRALGSRIASSDYADPKTLFSQNYHSLANKNIAHVQRDSAFSLTSSNDSVNITTTPDIHATKLSNQQLSPVIQNSNNALGNNKMGKLSPSHSSSSSSGDDSYYEKTVETYLENDGIFRDSAIYSDDNNEKPYMRLEHIYSTIEEIKQEENKVKPQPPPKLNAQKRKSIVTRTAPPIPEKPIIIAPVLPSRIGRRSEPVTDKEKQMPSHLPPSLPKSMPPILVTADKPTFIVVSKPQIDSVDASHTDASSIFDGNRDSKNCMDSAKQPEMPNQLQQLQTKPEEQHITPPPVPARNISTKNTSWVLKQIQNFDK